MDNQTNGTAEKKIRINLPRKTVEELERRADAIHLSAAEYAECVLMECIRSGAVLALQED